MTMGEEFSKFGPDDYAAMHAALFVHEDKTVSLEGTPAANPSTYPLLRGIGQVAAGIQQANIKPGQNPGYAEGVAVGMRMVAKTLASLAAREAQNASEVQAVHRIIADLETSFDSPAPEVPPTE